MHARPSDASTRAWDAAVFGVPCLKTNQSGQKPRPTRVFLHPTEPSSLCWLSKWKDHSEAIFSLVSAQIEVPASLEVFAKSTAKFPLVLKAEKKRLTLGFESAKDRDALVKVFSAIVHTGALPR